MTKLLVIDDEPEVRHSLESTLRSSEIVVLTADSGQAGIATAERERPDCIVLDLRLPDMSGLEVFDQLRAIDPRVPVIFITDFSTTEIAIEAMRRGAFEYLLKPLDVERLRSALDEALEVSRISHVPAVVDTLGLPEPAGDHIVGESQAMQQVYKLIGRVAPQDVTVLVQGESGTGKELVARAIYHYSRRSHMPFLAINCAAIPENLLESELFGHEKGAFTGADRRRIGKFEQLDGGTIFLDEIGDMSAATQAKVLRVLQEQRFERVGSNETIRTNVRVIAATNRDLNALAAQGQFRIDLYYRLSGFTIRLPALRDRAGDVAVLASHFLRQMSRDVGKQVRVITPEALELLNRHPWLGNVRELQSAIKYAIVRTGSDVVTVESLPEHLRPSSRAVASDSFDLTQLITELLARGETDLYRIVHNEVDRVLLEEALKHVRGSQLEAAALLGISRTTLRAKLRALGMAIEKHVSFDRGDESP